ncbi:TAZ zinc finger domain protein [Nitzschia inconspicua]|uniref:TAZ zinc finger domain protein n=1 Tax=Nitzschia inconspicua TaxID=303405 RepID=A0A9K3PMT6_9STRA|nr:TAZ zinc finger domain protein [Nitzschia inconspicua]
MSSSVSLLSLSSHRSKDFGILSTNRTIDNEIGSLYYVMAGNEYTPTNCSGPPSTSSTFAGPSNHDVSNQGSANQGQIAVIASAVEPRHPSLSEEPPSKKIKLEHDEGISSLSGPSPTNPVGTMSKGADDRTQLDSTSPAALSTAYGAGSTQMVKEEAAPQYFPSTDAPSQIQDAHNGSAVLTSTTHASHQTGQSSTNSSKDSMETKAAVSSNHSASGISFPITSQVNTAASSSFVPPPAAAIASNAAADPAAAPLKSLTFAHLSIKYLAELEYMLREFRKLERQLLGAKGAAQLEESAGSRERREKLHSFILHLEDTVRQIEQGCKLEAEGKSAVGNGSGEASNASEDGVASKKQMARESALPSLTKEEEENVSRLEEHILANLLPVKVRLKKQLAAQQGATQNPAGMPSRRGSLQPPSAGLGKGTFAEAAEKKRKEAEAARLAAQEQHERTARRVTDPTQFGKPLGKGGSSLTRNLHGATLGSTQRIHGHGVGVASKTDEGSEGTGSERKILYAGMVPGSTQQKSGLSAASGVHDMVTTIQGRSVDSVTNGQEPTSVPHSPPTPQVALASRVAVPVEPKLAPKAAPAIAPSVSTIPKQASTNASGTIQKKSNQIFGLSEEEQRKLKKKRRKRKLQRLARRQERERQKPPAPVQQQAPGSLAPTNSVTTVRKKSSSAKGQKKKGPRAVEYICALCSETYNSTCDYNPWWSLAQHECPKCRKMQIPRLDIAAPANAIEYHPALLAHVEDNSGNSTNSSAASCSNPNQATAPAPELGAPDGKNDPVNDALESGSDTDLSELSDDDMSLGSLNTDDSESDFQSMSPAEQAEHETFGSEYNGPCLPDEHANRLLILMGHASTCPCQHRSHQHQEICKSTKYMMLHVRDCPGTTATLDVCPFPWCRKVKHLLYHLVSCQDPDACQICSQNYVSKNMKDLVGLNAHRMKRYRQKMIAAAKAAMEASRTKPASSSKQSPTGTGLCGSKTNAARSLVPVAPAPVPLAPLAKGGKETCLSKKTDAPRASATTTASDPKTSTRTPGSTRVQSSEPVQLKMDDLPTELKSNSSSQLVPDPTAAVEFETVATQDDDNDVLPTPISAMKMEDDEEENAEVTELLAGGPDDEHSDMISSPTEMNPNCTALVSEPATSNTSSSEISPGGRSSSDTPHSHSPSPATASVAAACAETATADLGSSSSSARVATATIIATTATPTDSVTVSSSPPATSDVEKTAGPVKVN